MNLEQLAVRRKRLVFRSWHRGTREMDLLMGSFADAYVKDFSADELALYEDILSHPDPDLYNWITGQQVPPANYMNAVLEKLICHRFKE